MEPERLLSGSSIICIGTLLMVPPFSVLSLALCHEALEGGGNHKMKTIISQKETSPLARKDDIIIWLPIFAFYGCEKANIA